MKTTICACILLLSAVEVISALPTDVTYTEGQTSVLYGANGKIAPAEIGNVLNTGDVVKTGADGLVELDQKGLVLKINPSTVFTLMERERGGGKTGVLSVALGSIKLRYDKLTGKEPMIQTASCAAGVRGTELTVFAGADGSSLIAVDSGAVEVEAEGATVELAAGEGVEVMPGRPPGDKFIVQRDQIDYRSWNDRKVFSMTADPAGSIEALTRLLATYAKNVADFDAQFQEYSKRLAEERQKAIDMVKEKGAEETRKYEEEVVFPLGLQTSNLFLNLRYNALAALSMRRYVAGRLYVLLKSLYIIKPDDPVYAAFGARYREFLDLFEQSIAPHLVAADI
jgi:hypothetical protein